jgi:DNA-binding response OmpR family regulator
MRGGAGAIACGTLVVDATTREVEMLEFRLLGPVELRADGQSLPAGPPRQRLVLAALLFDAGRLVTWETVADRVWGDAVPRDGHHSLQAHISRLRGVLRRAAGATGEPLPIVFRSGGYVLEAEPPRWTCTVSAI